jgi:ubiquinone/menaquinone biosynthesis C-methylase UbiE
MTPWLRRILIVVAILAVLAGVAWIERDWIVARLYILMLESDDRVESLRIERVIEVLEIGPGVKVADIGAGTGIFARPFAAATGRDGTVYAVDINPQLVDYMQRTAREQGLAGLRTVLAAEDDPRLPEPVDLVFFCDALHHIEDREVYLGTLRRYLRPGGRLAVIDFEGNSPHLDPDMRYTREELDGWAGEAGFVFEASHDFIEDNLFLVYRCEGCPD